MAGADQMIKPIFQVQHLLTAIADIGDTRQSNQRSYFSDLFMMMANVNTRSMPVEAVMKCVKKSYC